MARKPGAGRALVARGPVASWPGPWLSDGLNDGSPVEASLKQHTKYTQIVSQSLLYQVTVLANGRPPAKNPSGLCSSRPG